MFQRRKGNKYFWFHHELAFFKFKICIFASILRSKFMDIHEVHLITFSPTHTSKQVGEAIVRGIGCSKTTINDLTLHRAERSEVPSNRLTVIAVPVYAGHVAPLALERMKDIHADGSPAVVVVVYGNRAYEKALADLDAFASGLGFKVIAGGTFIGEHSYSNEKNPVAPGRPDADDLKYAELFLCRVLRRRTLNFVHIADPV